MMEENTSSKNVAVDSSTKPSLADSVKESVVLTESSNLQLHLPELVNDPAEVTENEIAGDFDITNTGRANLESDESDSLNLLNLFDIQDDSASSRGSALSPVSGKQLGELVERPRRLALILLASCFVIVIAFAALLPKLVNSVTAPGFLGVIEMAFGAPPQSVSSLGARSYAAAGKFKEALKDVTASIDLDRTENRRHWLDGDLLFRGSIYRELGRYSDALADTGAVLARPEGRYFYHWQSSLAVVDQAKLHLLSGAPELAIADIENGIVNDGSLAGILPEFLVFAGVPEKAVEKYNQSLETRTPQWQIRMAFALSRAHHYVEARNIVDNALWDVSQTVIKTPFGAAPVLEELGTHGLQMKSLYPDDHGLFSSLFEIQPRTDTAFAYELSGRYHKAEQLASEIIKADPKLPIAYRIRAGALMAGNKFAEALEDLNKAIALNPEYGKAYFERAIVNKQLGKLDDAQKDKAAAGKFGWGENHDQAEKLERR